MAEPKTKKTTASVEKFLSTFEDEGRRDDCREIIKLMASITKDEPAMWGSAIVGFGRYSNVTANGKAADWPIAAFSPRKQNMTIYLWPGFQKNTELMRKLGTKVKSSKACLYFKKLDDLHVPTLKQLIKNSVQDLNKHLATQKKENQIASDKRNPK